MYALLAVSIHAAFSTVAAVAVAPFSVAAGATLRSLWVLGLASALLSVIGLTATSAYLSRHLKLGSGLTVGWLCGLLCAGILALSLDARMDYSLITYLALLAPTLLAITLASVLDKPKSGWQT